MRLLKNFAKNILEKKGYGIVKLNPIVEREIYHAHYLGECFRCIKGDPLTEDILKGKIWDSQIPEILNAVNPDNGDVVEIGANIGTSILPHSHHYPNLRFKLYEPVPAFYNLLYENFKTYNKKNNVEIYNHAFGSKENEEIEIKVGLGTAGKTALVHYLMHDKSLKIKSHTLDHIYGSNKISFIKLDVDGHEYSVLQGAKNILKSQHPLLFLEFAPRVMTEVGQSPNLITDLLKDAGYNLIKIWDHDSQYIKTTKDWNELIKLGQETPHYLNILISKN